MQCTREEIEEKRKQALQKLASKTLPQNSNTSNSKPWQPAGLQRQNTASSLKFDADSRGNWKSPLKGNLRPPNAKPYSRPAFANNYENAKSSGSGLMSKAQISHGHIAHECSPSKFYGNKSIITGTCVLTSGDRFSVELSGFSSPAIDMFKSIPTRQYNSNTRNWNFHIKDYELLHNRLKLLRPDVCVGVLPAYVLRCCNTPKPNYSKIDLKSIDQELYNTLMPFQEEGICFGVDKNGKCFIADDMGLGKTIQALGIADYYRKDWPLLIVTTSSMKNTWEETIHKYLPSISIMETQYMVTTKDFISDSKILIVSHDMMSRAVGKLLERNFGVLIVDESHILKNFKAKCTKAATALAKKAKRVILLSGTPALSRPSELFTQLSLINEKFFGSFIDFSKRYCDGKATNFGWDASGKSNLQELEIVLSKAFMIRRTKDEVLKCLPDKAREIVMLDVNLNQFSVEDRRSLNALADNYNRQKKAGEKHAALLTFFSESSKIKIPSVCSYILQILNQTKKFLVFAHHQRVLDAIERILVKKEKKFIRIDGSSSSEQRKYFVDKFQLDDEYACAILSITAANAGITLTAATLVLFAELHWNPSILSQAESRAHRIGQEGKVTIRYLLAPGTADDSIWPMLESKQKILNEAGLNKESFADVAVTKQDLSFTEDVAQCLHSTSLTSAKTLDITSYFKSPTKESIKNGDDKSGGVEEEDYFNDDFDDANIMDISDTIEAPKKEPDKDGHGKNDGIEDMDYFNDDLDDVLGCIDV